MVKWTQISTETCYSVQDLIYIIFDPFVVVGKVTLKVEL